jgi:hypothetical protein
VHQRVERPVRQHRRGGRGHHPRRTHGARARDQLDGRRDKNLVCTGTRDWLFGLVVREWIDGMVRRGRSHLYDAPSPV